MLSRRRRRSTTARRQAPPTPMTVQRVAILALLVHLHPAGIPCPPASACLSGQHRQETGPLGELRPALPVRSDLLPLCSFSHAHDIIQLARVSSTFLHAYRLRVPQRVHTSSPNCPPSHPLSELFAPQPRPIPSLLAYHRHVPRRR